ncbi:MAG: hypothetical protein PHI41_09910 [Erysipelotrichaceae bacterium]|nr:hypothetical protein [Erysipelotrichaceae bacterium]MDD3809172.1 hypothetical protein [Erysipelotrichaceae bacterium]
MNEDIQSAMNQIKLINNSIEKAKNKGNIIGKMFIYFGIINLVNYILSIISSLFISSFSEFILIGVIINAIMLATLYLEVRKILKTSRYSTNIYFLGFLRLFVFITFLLPLILLAARFFLFYFTDIDPSLFIAQSTKIRVLSNLVLFFYALINFTNLSSLKRNISLIALAIFMIFVLYVMDIGLNFSLNNYVVSYYLWSIVLNLMFSIGYVIIGIRIRQKELQNGN